MPRREHLILCGGLEEPRAGQHAVARLHLHGPDANVTLRISDIAQKLLVNVPAPLVDLLEIATYVYAADGIIPRGGKNIVALAPTILRSGMGEDQMLAAMRTEGRRKVRTDVRLLVRHFDQTRCFVCGLPDNGSFAPVKTCDPDHFHRVHLQCFDEHSRREKARWDAVVAQAFHILSRDL